MAVRLARLHRPLLTIAWPLFPPCKNKKGNSPAVLTTGYLPSRGATLIWAQPSSQPGGDRLFHQYPRPPVVTSIQQQSDLKGEIARGLQFPTRWDVGQSKARRGPRARRARDTPAAAAGHPPPSKAFRRSADNKWPLRSELRLSWPHAGHRPWRACPMKEPAIHRHRCRTQSHSVGLGDAQTAIGCCPPTRIGPKPEPFA
jgi:hypothetical protein